MNFLAILFVTFTYIYVAAGQRECTTPGPMCATCELLVSCVSAEDEFIQQPGGTCAAGETCLGNACTSDRNPKCDPPLDFRCNDIGVFPDPFDCQSFHFCVPESPDTPNALKNYEARCDGSWGYHAGTTFCQTRLENNVCFAYANQFPIELCMYAGQTGALIQNPTIYYICAQHNPPDPILYPFQFVCPHGGTYYNYQCLSAVRHNLNKLMHRI